MIEAGSYDPVRSVLAQSAGSFWLPSQSSTSAGQVDSVFALILYIAAFFFALIVVLMVAFVVRYRRRPGQESKSSASHNTALEVTWTVIPVILVCVIFYMGFKSFMDLRVAPPNAMQVNVMGQKWNWLFDYPARGINDKRLHVPANEPIKLVMTSQDVIHSLYVPAFRIKMDLIPGRYTSAWFEATEPGVYPLYCTEYCGTGHSDMITEVVVHKDRAEFEKWVAEAEKERDSMPLPELGKTVVTGRGGCIQCHNLTDEAGQGPGFKGLFGSTRTFSDGSTEVADENYIRESIIEPQAKIVAGYDAIMPTYKGRFKEREILGIIEFLRTLSDKPSAEGAQTQPAAAP